VSSRSGSAAGLPLAVIAGLFLASIAMRPQILAVGPLLPLMRADLGLPASLAGLLTTVPVLCMGLFAPLGPRVAGWLGTRRAFAACLAWIAGLGALRAVVPGFPLVLLATLGIGVGTGVAGSIPAMIVSTRVATRPALGTGAYAGGIVAGSSLAAALAVPLAIGGQWRLSLLVISLASIGSVVAWLALVRGDGGVVRGGSPRTLPWRNGRAWLLMTIFGLQSIMYYGVVAWLPNAFVERGWSAADAGSLVAVCNGVGLITTLGVPLFADRYGSRGRQLALCSAVATVVLAGLILVPTFAFGWVAILGLALGAVFPLVLTLPIDVTDAPSLVGPLAAFMLLGGYIISSTGPTALGLARDLTGDFTASLWMLVVIGAILVGTCLLLSPARLARRA